MRALLPLQRRDRSTSLSAVSTSLYAFGCSYAACSRLSVARRVVPVCALLRLLSNLHALSIKIKISRSRQNSKLHKYLIKRGALVDDK